jgi:hypothetical protein
VRNVNAQASAPAGVGERGREVPIGPVLGVAAGIGEDELHLVIARLQSGELIGGPAAVDVVELVEL